MSNALIVLNAFRLVQLQRRQDWRNGASQTICNATALMFVRNSNNHLPGVVCMV